MLKEARDQFDQQLEYLTPDPELLVVTITQVTVNGKDGIGDDAFFLRNGHFERGQFYLIWRKPQNQGKPIRVVPKGKKEEVEDWELVPDNRDYEAWGRIGTITGFYPNREAFVVQDDSGFRYYAAKKNYKPQEPLDVNVDHSSLKIGDEIIFHRTKSTLEDNPNQQTKSTYLEPICWYPAAEEGEGYVQYARHLLAIDPDDFDAKKLDWMPTCISKDNENPWRKMMEQILSY